ncbi:ABC transporter ATP-binding protein [Hydrogenophaga sp.]|uniref:ABC transporter ATP-binding protein n=1 Tax=Hydrogenophaga sp. TaxID=1904254 RepID=UPI0027274377|nr:ABC transporter ATP-binding protein [Hydrogenophaga sp.]MDO9435991.1 ABC transporter ATP-binding protein [Hydrogenophaga sp.]
MAIVKQSPLALRATGLTKQFGGVIAVDGVDFSIPEGQVHAFIGPNGAGKTTLFSLITKTLTLTKGRLEYFGEDVAHIGQPLMARKGMVRSFQISSIFNGLPVIENVRLALLRASDLSKCFWRGDQASKRYNQESEEILELVGLHDMRTHQAAQLPYGKKRALELAITIATRPRILLLDEPTAGLGREDIERITQLIKKIASGRTVLIVEHNLGVVAALADKVTVLARGKVIANGTYREMTQNAEVTEAYFGRSKHGK